MVKETIHHILAEQLKDVEYESSVVPELQKKLAEKVKTGLKGTLQIQGWIYSIWDYVWAPDFPLFRLFCHLSFVWYIL